jgi:hypothetical protein
MASGTQVRRVLLQIQADDGDSESKLDAIAAKADELAKKHPELKVKIDTAAASAKIKVLRDDLKATAAAAGATPIIPEVDNSAATVKVDDLKLKLDELAAKAADVKIGADDADARVKILGIQARLAELGDKVARPDIKVSGAARAEADIAAVSLELDKLGGKGGGIFSKLGGLFGGGGSGGGGGASALFSGGMTSPAGIAAIAASVVVLLPEVGALATGLTAAGAGAGSFALLAAPAFGKVHTAYTQIQADQQAYDRALTSSGRKTALAHLQQDWKSLNPAETGAVKGVQQLTGEFGKMSKAFEPTAFKVFDAALKDANEVLPYIGKFATAASPAIEQLVGGLGKFLAGGQFKHFASFLESLSGPSIKAIGSGFAGLAPQVMNLMELFSKKDVVNSINIAFRGVGLALTAVIGVIKLTTWNWDTLTRQMHNVAHGFDVTRHVVASFGHDYAKNFDDVRHVTATWAHDTAAHFDEIRHDIAQWAGDVRHDADNVVHWFERLPGEVEHGLSSLVGNLEKLGVNAVSGLLHGLQSKIGGIEQDAQNWGHDIANALGAPFGVHFSEPSQATMMVKLGQQITAGLASGVNHSAPQAIAEAGKLGEEISAALAAGQINSKQAQSLQNRLYTSLAAAERAIKSRQASLAKTMFTLGLELNGTLLRALEGNPSQVKSSVAKLESMVKSAFSAGDIGQSSTSSLTSWLERDGNRLQSIATKRASILATIKTADAYAASTATSIRNTDNLASASAGGFNGGPQTNAQIVGNLRAEVGKIQQFSAAIAKLRKMGLNSAYLSQLISMGPDAGLQLAQQLATGGLTDIHQINSAESSIYKASGQLGKTAANAMYDSGTQAGKGFLSGLESQQSALEKMMSRLADTMVNTIKHDLDIHSPSGKARALTRDGWGAGLILGLQDSHAGVQTASSRLARAVASHGGPGGAGGASGGQVVTVRIDLSGAPRELRTFLKKSIRTTGGNVEVIGA